MKGNYGNLKGGLEPEKPHTTANTLLAQMDELNSDREEDLDKNTDSKAGDLFKKKGLAIGKLAAMNFVSSTDKARMKEEQYKHAEEFRNKREQIKREQENKKRLVLNMNKLEEELLGNSKTEQGNEVKKKRDMDELSVSSGEGEVFIHNLMGFRT